MPSVNSSQWQEKASGFFSSSGVKLKEAGQSAGTFVGGVAKDAKGNAADVAERVGSLFKSRWALLQQPATRHAVQERLICAAATTGTFLRKGVTETKDKVVVGKVKVEEVAKKTAQKSKTILTDIERWQKGVASTDLFGVQIEVTVQKQQSSRVIPHILVRCADYLVLSGLNSPCLFKSDGDERVLQRLVSMYNQDPNAPIPEGTNPVDVAALAKCYLASLPEPLVTFELYNEIRGAHTNLNALRNILKKLPNVNYMTLEFTTALFLRISQKALLNKAGTLSLSRSLCMHACLCTLVYIGLFYEFELTCKNILCLLVLVKAWALSHGMHTYECILDCISLFTSLSRPARTNFSVFLTKWI
ncbi:uncharacterized Rho GTPase-activating protein At5g61530 isoform X2 [Cucurbita moschata]|uniref:Uncharacterized Rho GTPase-activating protein At5g61530 isoform X2 n=1 Tax=Cucurbita moschata TaxID=3662 RepID=A0A6J1E4Y7_CUCMO|nr:uncharacterized Rho GTPase-activating protein At5g61530 isoform X2 [Cucurbita moschata]